MGPNVSSNPLGYLGISKIDNPGVIEATAAPATTNIAEIGTVWINTSANQAYTLTSVVANSATWALSSPGDSDVDTINSLSPTAGNMLIDGGTNLTDSNAGSTITLNMDAAITLATSVTSALYTTAAATDLLITGVAGQNIDVQLGDNAGADFFRVLDSDSAMVFQVDSNGGLTMGAVTFTGLITGQAGMTLSSGGNAISLGADNSADALILGGGTSARAITIGQDAAAHTIAIGQAAAGAITVDTAAGVSIDAATASNFTVTGAGADLTLASAGGSVLVSSTEDAALAIRLHADAGTSETIQIHSDQGTGVASIDLLSDVGGISLVATGLASADAINLNAAAGGVDIDGALQVNIESAQNAADAVRINASAGGIDIDAAGAAGEDIDIANAAGSVNLTAGEAIANSMVFSSTNGGIDILCPGAGAGLDIDITNTGGSIRLSATESATDAINIEATAGGVNLLASGAAAGEDINITATGSSVNVTSTEDNAGAIYLHANGGVSERIRLHADQGTATDSVALLSDAGGIDLTATAGGISLTSSTDITLAGTVKEVNSEFAFSSGTDLTITQSPVMQSNATTGAAPSGATGDINLMQLQDGCLMECFILGAGQTILAPRMVASNGLSIGLDLVDNEGAEYNFGARANAKHAYTIGTSPAFFLEMTLFAADLSGLEPLWMGWRVVEANNATWDSYTDFYGIGMNNATSATNIALTGRLNSGGVTLQTSGTAWTGGDGGTVTLRVLVSAAGVITATIDGGAPSSPLAQTFDNADVVMPCLHFLHDTTTPGVVGMKTLKCGFQA